ncbi:hypothetical protein HMN09_01329600 [Mycena chlorophos]|uniref:Uncharacterized protein n=1 Tax=Mycena chlorophos TaxID=658473 RepID=A0A8H6RXN6_MYCCL|nr:hypothetical protein HMN09_01329600 [Mycena chlorophos]
MDSELSPTSISYLEDMRLGGSANNDAKENSSDSEPARDHSASLLSEYLTFGFYGELGTILVPLTVSGAEDLQHLAQARLKSALSEQRVLNIRLHDAEQYLALFKAEEEMIQRRIDTAARDVARVKEMLEAAGLAL